MRKIDGVPADEMFLAKIIQNAKAFDLKACKGREFLLIAKDANELGLSDFPVGKEITLAREVAIGVCALGAAKLAKDTRRNIHKFSDMVGGNDSSYKKSDAWINRGDTAGYTVGAAFQQAMNE